MNANIVNLFYIKRAKSNNSGLVPIFQRITVDGQRIERSTGKYINPELWSSEGAKLKGKTDLARSINSHLDLLLNEVIEAEKDLVLHRQPVNYHSMKSKLTGDKGNQRMLVPIFKAHNSRIKALVAGGEYAQGTVDRYTTSLSHTTDFLQWKFKSSDIALEDIDYAFVTDYDFYLRTERKCANNTTIKYLKNFQKIINECLDNEWITKDPFLKYKPKLKTVERDFLTEDEIEEMYGKIFLADRLTLVRDIFIFSCFTGLAYIDVQKLTPANISIGIDGSKWIFTKREKTEGPSHIPLLPIAEEMIEKYREHPKCLNKNVVFPILSNQRMNSYLKEIADVCGINKELTFHIARHTFATTVTLSNGVPLESVSKMLGHKSWKSTQIYAKVLDTKVSKDMNILKSKYQAQKTETHSGDAPQQTA